MARVNEINNGIQLNGDVFVGGDMRSTTNSGNKTETVYNGGNYSGAINSGNEDTKITDSGNRNSRQTHGDTNVTHYTNSNNVGSTIVSNNNSNNQNSNNTGSGNDSNNTTNTGSNNTTFISNSQGNVALTDSETVIQPAHQKLMKEAQCRKEFLLSPHFFDDAQERSSAIAWVDGESIGTGFMISDRLMVTSRYVLPNATVARKASIVFGYEEQVTMEQNVKEVYSTTLFRLDPSACFLENEKLDIAVVAIAETKGPTPWKKPIPLKRNPYMMKHSKVTFNIIQHSNGGEHPDGGPKRFALRGWKMQESKEGIVRYDTETCFGSSGSPVFNDLWELVAVHHSFDKKSNIGTHVNVIIDWILKSTAKWTGQQKSLIDALQFDSKPNVTLDF